MQIALTGGIGSGKSTVAAMLVACGARLFDADAVSRELTAPGGAALEALEREFGAACRAADGGLDRAWMRALVFQDTAARRRLEGILHPMIGRRAQQALAEASSAGQALVLDIPLLGARSPWRHMADRVLVVDCSEQVQAERVMARSGLQAQEVQRIIASQISRAARRALGDAVILNEGLDLHALQGEVQSLWQRWAADAGGCGTIGAP